MSRLVYGMRADLKNADAEDIAEQYEDWISEYYEDETHRVHGYEAIAPLIEHRSGHRLFRQTLEGPIGTLNVVDWSIIDDRDSNLVWRNIARFGAVDGEVFLEHQTFTETKTYSVSERPIFPASPKVVRKICEDHEAYVGALPVNSRYFRLDTGDIDEFTKLLLDERRRIPVVLLAPYAGGTPNIVSPRLLSQRLAGLSFVVLASTPEVTRSLSSRLPDKLGCYDGGVRIYWPGTKFSAEEYKRHPVYLGGKLRHLSESRARGLIERRLFRVSALSFAEDPRANAVVENDRLEQLTIIRKKNNSSELEAFLEQYERDLEKLDSSRAEANSLRRSLERAQTDVSNLEVQIEYLRDFNNRTTQIERSDTEPELETVLDVIEWADQSYDTLLVLPSALASAEKCPYTNIDALKRLIDALDSSASVLRKPRGQRPGKHLQQLLLERGQKAASGISDTAATRFRNDYLFEFEGEKQLFGPHTTLGTGDANRCMSVHYKWNSDRGQVIIAYAGRHLRNTLT